MGRRAYSTAGVAALVAAVVAGHLVGDDVEMRCSVVELEALGVEVDRIVLVSGEGNVGRRAPDQVVENDWLFEPNLILKRLPRLLKPGKP